MIEVVPAVIPKSFEDVRYRASQVSGLVPMIQIDVDDGRYGPVRTWPYARTPDSDFEKLLSEAEGLPDWENLNYEVDLIVSEPEKRIDDWIRAGVTSAVIHIESTERIAEAIEKARYADLKVGLALKPSTPNEALYEWMEEIDFVQFMGNDKVGYNGVELDRKVLKKIRELRKEYPNFTIGIDIGVDMDTAPELVEAGANRLVSGSAVYENADIAETIDYFENL